MQRAWMQFALFINAITPVHFLICAALYAFVLQEVGLSAEVPVFITSIAATLGVVGVLKLVCRVERRKDALVKLNSKKRAFPSGHAASSALIAIIVPYTLSNTLTLTMVGVTAGVLAIGAVLVSASRLTLKVHTRFQIAVGLAIGIAGPLLCIYYLTPVLVGLF